MGELVADTIVRCVEALENRDVEMAQRLIAADSRIDENRYDVENRAIVLIATQQPMAGDLRLVAAVLTIATELERIGDYCEGIAALTLRMAPNELKERSWPAIITSGLSLMPNANSTLLFDGSNFVSNGVNVRAEDGNVAVSSRYRTCLITSELRERT